MDVVLFGADWCGNCTPQKEMLDDAGIEYEYVDVDESTESQERANKYNVRSLPTTIVLDGDEVADSFIGMTQLDKLEDAIDR
jgi:glutaredoxin